MMKPITKRAQEARMRQNGVTPLKQTGDKDNVDVVGAVEFDKDEQKIAEGNKKETKQQGTSTTETKGKTDDGKKDIPTQPRPYTFEARATPKQKARQEVGAQKIRQRGADKLDKIADKQNRKRAAKELKGLRREAMDKKRLDGLTFKERREVGQAFRRGDYKSVLGSEDAKRATQLRGTKKGYTPDDEKPSTSSKPSTPQKPKNKMAEGMTKSYVKGNAATMKPVNIKPVPDLDKKVKPESSAKPAKVKKVKDKEFIKQNKLENREARKENRQANRAINKENRQANRAAKRADKETKRVSKQIDRGQIDKDGNVITRKQMRKNRREGFAEDRKVQKAKKQEVREQKKLDKAIDKAVKRGVKGSEKTAKKLERQKNSRKNKREETKQVKQDFANDPISARFEGKSPKQVKRMLNRDLNKRLKTARKSERLRKRGKLGPNESLVSKRDQRNRANYETALEMSKGSTPVNLPKKEIPKVSSPMKMMGVTGNSGPLKKGYFKNK